MKEVHSDCYKGERYDDDIELFRGEGDEFSMREPTKKGMLTKIVIGGVVAIAGIVGMCDYVQGQEMDTYRTSQIYLK